MSTAAADGAVVAPTAEPATDVPTSEPEAVVPETTPATEQQPSRLFRFSRYVHVGDGASECEGREDGTCTDPNHVHLWVRLPNQFQHDSIRQKALAMKARRIRQLKDPEGDAHAILEADLDAIREADGAHSWLVEDLVNREFLKHHDAAMQEIKEREEFQTIGEDLERLKHLESLPEDQRSAEEFEELQRHIAEFTKLVEEERDEQEKPLRAALQERSVDELISQVRDERIEAEATQEFMRGYSQWEWYTCTLKPRDPAKGLPSERRWPHINEMLSEAPEVLEAVDMAFSELEAALKGGQGNS